MGRVESGLLMMLELVGLSQKNNLGKHLFLNILIAHESNTGQCPLA